MKLSVDDGLWHEPRFLTFCQAMGIGRIAGVGTLVLIWTSTRKSNFVRGPQDRFFACLQWEPDRPKLVAALAAGGYVELHDDGTLEVCGNEQWQRLRQERAEAGRKGRAKAAEVAAKRRARRKARLAQKTASLAKTGKDANGSQPPVVAAHPPIKPVRRKPAAAKEPTALQQSCSATWEAYSRAYQARWGVVPTRNARVNACIKQFVQRVGMSRAPDIVRFFVGHNEREYLRAHHTITLAVRDAEALATQWERGQPITTRDIIQMEDQMQVEGQLAQIGAGLV